MYYFFTRQRLYRTCTENEGKNDDIYHRKKIEETRCFRFLFSIHGLSDGLREMRPDCNFRRFLETVSSTIRHRKIYTRRPLSYFIRPLRYDVPVFVLSVSPSVIYTVRGDVAHEIPLKKKNESFKRVSRLARADSPLSLDNNRFSENVESTCAVFDENHFGLRRSNSIRTTRS